MTYIIHHPVNIYKKAVMSDMTIQQLHQHSKKDERDGQHHWHHEGGSTIESSLACSVVVRFGNIDLVLAKQRHHLRVEATNLCQRHHARGAVQRDGVVVPTSENGIDSGNPGIILGIRASVLHVNQAKPVIFVKLGCLHKYEKRG